MPIYDQEYAWSRIEHAVKESENNLAKAQRMLMSWAEVDDDLLRGLAEPHIKSLISYALQQVVSDDDDNIESVIPERTENLDIKQEKALDDDQMKIGSFGMELLQNMTGGRKPQSFGFVTDEVEAPQKASKQHVDAILQLAKSKE